MHFNAEWAEKSCFRAKSKQSSSAGLALTGLSGGMCPSPPLQNNPLHLLSSNRTFRCISASEEVQEKEA